MKKIVIVFLSLFMIVNLTGCGNKKEQSEQETTNKEEKQEKIEVDEGLLEVTITIPASFYESFGVEVSQESLNEESAEAGYKSVTLNNDGSVTYVMTKNQHKQMMSEMADSLEETLQEIIDDESTSITNIKHNKSFTEFDVTLSTNEVGLYESFTAIAIYMYGSMYSMFNGDDVDNIYVRYLDSKGNLIQEANSKDMGE